MSASRVANQNASSSIPIAHLTLHDGSRHGPNLFQRDLGTVGIPKSRPAERGVEEKQTEADKEANFIDEVVLLQDNDWQD